MPSPLDQPETSTPSQRIDNDASIAQPLAVELPPAGDSRQTSDKGRAVEADGEEVHTLDVGEGNVVKLDRLGPMIINSDGTLSRIQNWQDLHPVEQERTVRLLVKKRNLVRLEKLDAEKQAEVVTSGEERLTALKDGGREGGQ